MSKHGKQKNTEKPDKKKKVLENENSDKTEEMPANTETLNARLLRLQADFDNYRKRMIRDRNEFAQRATEDLILELLPILDHFELGIKTARQHQAEQTIIDGFQLVYDQLINVLTKAGVKTIDARGEVFDPHIHEAVTHIPSDEYPADVVIEQTRRGYMLGDKLLRAAQVVVSSGPADQAAIETQLGDSEGEE